MAEQVRMAGGSLSLWKTTFVKRHLTGEFEKKCEREKLSTYKMGGAADTWQSSKIKEFFNKHPGYRHGLLIVVLFGTCMSIGDGVLTPTISVLSAVSGVKVKLNLHENHVVAISCVILVGLFSLQHHGRHRGWNLGVLRALSPWYLIRFLRSTGVEGWVSLGGVVLCITGTETMFAALGHCSPASVKHFYPSTMKTYREASIRPYHARCSTLLSGLCKPNRNHLKFFFFHFPNSHAFA